MTDKSYPTVPEYPLPAPALRAPLTARRADAERREARPVDPSDLREALTEAISESIARKARQRRYTP